MATIKDVAKHADVSIATVSRIINNKGPISEKTRNKVYHTMKELNYQPNEMARALQMKKSHIIGVIVPAIRYAFFSTLIESVEETCNKNGYKLMLCRSGANEEREIEMVSLLEGNKVDGIIVCSRLGDAAIYTEKVSMPIVSIDREIEGISMVTSDNYQGGVSAARKLCEMGCRRPVLAGNLTPEYMSMNQRNIGFFDECHSRNIEAGYIEIHSQIEEKQMVVDSFMEQIRQQEQIDGLFFTSDALASMVVCSDEVKASGLTDKMPFISYDGLEISELLGFSSVEQPIYEMGKAAVLKLIDAIEGRQTHSNIVLPVRLIERNSTKKFEEEK